MAHVNIEGPAGLLEARLEGEGSTVGILCHPHPLYGGSMDDLVLEAMASALLEAGIAVLRFNFRGTGHSAGRHDQGKGEVDDLLAACNWVRQEHREIVLTGGYSFGAVMSLSAGNRSGAGRQLLVAPPVSMLADVSPPTVACCVILGDEDPFVDVEEAQAWFGSSAEVDVLPHADHFFHGFHDRITQIAVDFLKKD